MTIGHKLRDHTGTNYRFTSVQIKTTLVKSIINAGKDALHDKQEPVTIIKYKVQALIK